MLAVAPAADAPMLPGCVQEEGTLCRYVYELTGQGWLAGSSDILIAKPGKILLILVVAFLVRLLVHRAVSRLAQRAAVDTVPRLSRLPGLRRGGAQVLADSTALLSERREQRTQTIASVLRSVTSIVVFTLAFILVLGELGLNLAPIVASAGIVGIAVGFGAQNLVKDFLTGMFMILEDQYGVGDVIDAGEATGSVEAVGLRTTRLRSVDGTVWHVRNGEILRVGNKSQGWSRALLDVNVAHSADIPRVRELLKQVADAVWHDPAYEGLVLEEPEVWGVETMEAQGLTVRLVVKTAPLKQWDIARELRQRIKASFDAEGIAVPQAGALLMSSGTGGGP